MLGLFFEEYWSVPLPESYFNISKSHFECRDLILLAKKKLGETLLAKKCTNLLDEQDEGLTPHLAWQ